MEINLLWIVPLIIFVISFAIEPRQFKNSLFFSFFLLMLIFTSAMQMIVHFEKIGMLKLAIGTALVIALMLPICILIGCLFLLLNGRTILQKEGRRLANMLSLFYGLAVLVLILSPLLTGYIVIKDYQSLFFINHIFGWLFLIIVYFTVIYVSHLLYSIFYIKWPLLKEPDYIIVLGSGLIGDKVPPLLAQRLDKGIEIYHKYQTRPRFVVSGGKGEDELIAEAEAMRLYLLEKGIPDQAIIVENKSTTTLENLTFSKHILDKISKKYYTVVVTNSFHVLRASIYARRVGLKGKGIGSKTAFYYMPSALIRENIGLLVMFKYWHIAFLSITVVPFVVIEIINFIWDLFNK